MDGVEASITALQLLALVTGISLAVHDHADPAQAAVSLVDLSFGGIAGRRR